MQASVSSTFGDQFDNQRLINDFKRLLVLSPTTYRGKPCIVFALVGPKGSNKSTIINILISIFTGGYYYMQRSSTGPELTCSTTQNTLIPLHAFIFEEPDPPAYFFIWDTIGISMNGDRLYNSDDGDIAAPIQKILDGSLRSYSQNLSAGRSNAKELLPAQAVIVTHHCGDSLNQVLEGEGENIQNQASFLKSMNSLLSSYPRGDDTIPYDHYQGIPMYCIASSYETIEPRGSPIYNVETRAEHWEEILTSSNLVARMHRLSLHTGIPYGRCWATFGLDVLRPTCGSNDVRISAVLLPFYSAVREVIYRSRVELQLAQFLKNRDNINIPLPPPETTSLMYMDSKRLSSHFAEVVDETAGKIIFKHSIDGECLITLSDEQIDRIFLEEESVGRCCTIKRIIRPYRGVNQVDVSPLNILTMDDIAKKNQSENRKIRDKVVFKGSITANSNANSLIPFAQSILKRNERIIQIEPNRNRFILAETGWFHIEVQVTTQSNTSNNQQLQLRKNGTIITTAYGANSNANGYWTTVSLADTVFCQQGEYLEVNWAGSAVIYYQSPSHNRFTITLKAD